MKTNVFLSVLLAVTPMFLTSAISHAELRFEKHPNRAPAPVARASGLSDQESRSIQQIARESGQDPSKQAFEDAVISCVAERVARRMEMRVQEREAERTKIKQEDSNNGINDQDDQGEDDPGENRPSIPGQDD